jgi:hypothetical protein
MRAPPTRQSTDNKGRSEVIGRDLMDTIISPLDSVGEWCGSSIETHTTPLSASPLISGHRGVCWLASNPFSSNLSTGCYSRIERADGPVR